MKKVDFSNGKIVQNILQTALPLLVAQLISLLYNIVDRIYIGRIPGMGTAALGAVGLCFPVIILIMAFTNMYGLGGSPLFAMENGRKNPKKAAAILNTAFRLQILTGLILLIIGEVACPQILTLFGATSKELVYAVPYLRIYLIGTLAFVLSTGMNPYLNAQGFAVIGMITVLVGAVTNIILDPIFIFLLGMGVQGAAIATVISQVLSAIIVLYFLFSDRNEFPIDGQLRMESGDGERRAILPHAGNIIGLGMAPFIMQVTNSLVSISCNQVLMATGGAMYVSVMTIVNSVRQILDTPIMAIADGASPVVSFNYGAEKPDEVKKAIRIMAMIGMSYTVLMWLFIEWKPGVLIGIFTSDPVLKEMALRPLHLYFFAFIFQSFQIVGQTVFKALNKKNFAIFFSLFRKVVMVVPLTYMLPYLFQLGTDGVFMAEPISNLVGGIACFTTMMLTVIPELNGMKKRKKQARGEIHFHGEPGRR